VVNNAMGRDELAKDKNDKSKCAPIFEDLPIAKIRYFERK